MHVGTDTGDLAVSLLADLLGRRSLPDRATPQPAASHRPVFPLRLEHNRVRRGPSSQRSAVQKQEEISKCRRR